MARRAFLFLVAPGSPAACAKQKFNVLPLIHGEFILARVVSRCEATRCVLLLCALLAAPQPFTFTFILTFSLDYPTVIRRGQNQASFDQYFAYCAVRAPFSA